MTLPVPKIEIAFATAPNDPSPAWVDVTNKVKAIDGMRLTHGRQDQWTTAAPATATLTLLNIDGRFTPGNLNSPYYPNVKKGRKIRITVTDNGVTYNRFVGYIDEWPVKWADASATVTNVEIVANARTARLGKARTLPTIIEVEYEQDSPSAFYTLGDAVGAQSAGNVAATPQSPMAITAFGGGSTTNVTFGNSGGPATTPLTVASFTRISGSAGAYLLAPLNNFSSGFDPSYLLETWVLATTAQEMGFARLDDGTSTTYLVIGCDASGHLITTYNSPGMAPTSTTSTSTVTNGVFHHVAVRQTSGSGVTTVTLFFDGASVATNSFNSSQFTHYRIIAGGGIDNSALVGSLCNVAAYTGTAITDARVQQHFLAGSTGFSGERSDQRISRLATYGGIPVAEVSVETGLSTSVTNQDTTGAIPVQLMQDITATEGGLLFDGVDGRLTFQARSHRYNQSSVLTLYGNSSIKDTLQPKLDDQGLFNDVTANRPNGVSVRAVDNNSVNDYGVYQLNLTLLTTLDNEVNDAANWKVYLGSQPQVIVPVATIELAGAPTVVKAAVLAREIGDRITLASLPVQAPASSMDFNIEGWTETITGESHLITFNLSNALKSGVWQLDSATYSQLDVSTRLAY